MGMGHSSYHFYQRVDRHEEVLHKRKREVNRALKKAVKGVSRNTTIEVHPTHFHVFGSVGDRREFVSRIKEEIAKLEGIKWIPEYYLTPVSSTSKKYVSQLLKDLHREIKI